VLLVLGDRSGLTPDCTTGETRDSADLALTGVQVELAKAVAAAGKPVALVLVSGHPLDLRELEPLMNAILMAWVPGEEGGNAIADVLTGAYNPAGRLVVSWPRSVGQVPLFYNHKPSGSTSNWYKDYVNESVRPLFAFGHGLSYAEFGYSDLKISPEKAGSGETITISCRVKNTSAVAGDEVVQLYIQDLFASLPRPVQELKGYIRLNLAAGEERQVLFHLPADALAYYDLNLNLQLEAGRFAVMVGASCADIRLRGEFEITGLRNTLIHNRVYHCPVEVR
jgi:beta-glucosidase